MESSSSQPETSKDNKNEPGPLMRLVLQSKNENSQSSTSVETKEPENSQSAMAMEQKEGSLSQPDKKNEPGPLMRLILQAENKNAQSSMPVEAKEPKNTWSSMAMEQKEGSSSQPENSKDNKNEPRPLMRLILQSENKNAQSLTPEGTKEPENAQSSMAMEQKEGSSSQHEISKDNKNQPGPLMRLILQSKNQNAQSLTPVETKEPANAQSSMAMEQKEGSSSQPEISKDNKNEPGPLRRLILQSENKNAQSSMPLETKEAENAESSMAMEQKEGSSSQPEMSKGNKNEPGPLRRLILQSENKNAQSSTPLETKEAENAQSSMAMEQKEGSSSQPEISKDNKNEPGPLMRLILQSKNKNAQSSTPVETKEPANAQSSTAMEQNAPVKDLNWYLPLYKAALKGDWESARNFFDQDPDAVMAKITKTSETALHIAVGTGKAETFVKELLELIPTEALVNLRDQVGQTALHYAAIFGNVGAAKLLVSKDPGLTNTPSGSSSLPIHLAALYANKDMVSYLLTVTRDDTDPNPFADKSGADLLNLVILAEFYDLALYVVQLYPSLATLRSPAGNTALNMIAGKPSALFRRSSLPFWHRLTYSCVPAKFGTIYSQDETVKENPAVSTQSAPKPCYCTQLFRPLTFSGCKKWHWVFWKFIEYLVPQVRFIRDARIMHLQTLHLVKCLCKLIAGLDYSTAASMFEMPILLASSLGNSEIVEEILESFPPAIWSRNRMGQNIFLLAVANRRENVFNLLYQMSEHKKLATQLQDIEGNNILHLAGKLAPSPQLNLVSGAALQMQRELQWYKEVEKYGLPDFKDSKNSKRRTPAVEFSVEHKDLIQEGEKWMKDTANSCTVAAALIATIAFAASITVPGGNDGDSGFPIFSNNTAFGIFAVFDALSLFSSTASMLMFLSILTARYAEGDFLYPLPKRLIIGLVTLFLSITSMMVAFSATLYLVFGRKKAWTLIPVAALACLPVTLFVTLQFPLLVSMFRSTYFPGTFGKRSGRLLF